jgi:CRP/FNR family transcriptional regulator
MPTTPPPPIDVRALLRGLPILAEVDAAAIDRLAGRCVTRAVGAGHLLFRAGDPCRGLYVLAEGRVRIFRVNRDGREQVLHIEGPGRPVAELPLFDGGAYPASAMTIEPSVLAFLPREVFEALYRSNADVAHAIIRALGKRLRHLVQLTETLAFRDVAARLALLLAGYAERQGEPGPDGVRLALERTQEELALEIGTARESVSRAFRQLERRGLVVREAPDRLLLPDVRALREISRGA